MLGKHSANEKEPASGFSLLRVQWTVDSWATRLLNSAVTIFCLAVASYVSVLGGFLVYICSCQGVRGQLAGVVSPSMWILGIKFRLSALAAEAFNHRAISLAWVSFFSTTILPRLTSSSELPMHLRITASTFWLLGFQACATTPCLCGDGNCPRALHTQGKHYADTCLTLPLFLKLYLLKLCLVHRQGLYGWGIPHPIFKMGHTVKPHGTIWKPYVYV